MKLITQFIAYVLAFVYVLAVIHFAFPPATAAAPEPGGLEVSSYVGQTTSMWLPLDLAVNDSQGQRILELSGVPSVPPPETGLSGPMASFQIRGPAYKRPATPNEVRVILVTADGKRWVAKWQEAQP